MKATAEHVIHHAGNETRLGQSRGAQGGFLIG